MRINFTPRNFFHADELSATNLHELLKEKIKKEKNKKLMLKIRNSKEKLNQVSHIMHQLFLYILFNKKSPAIAPATIMPFLIFSLRLSISA